MKGQIQYRMNNKAINVEIILCNNLWISHLTVNFQSSFFYEINFDEEKAFIPSRKG